MMRRIEARISSIEGSVTFAGCVISDSTSSTPSHALFYIKPDKICRFRICGLGFSSHKPDLSPDQAPSNRQRGPAPAQGFEAARPLSAVLRESPCCPPETYVIATIDCKQGAGAFSAARSSRGQHAQYLDAISGRPACGYRSSCHAPDDSERSDRKP